MTLQIPIEIWILLGSGVAVLIGGVMIYLAVMYLARRKIRHEVGLYIRHHRYHPDRPVREFHFEDYAATHVERPDGEK